VPRDVMPLESVRRFFATGEPVAGGWSAIAPRGRGWESSYRDRWQHDRVVRSTHRVNCTGSCSWQVHVKEGIVTWETQQTDYPENGPDVPDYEPRGCPRGASFSWYVYSPLRVRHPYVRGELIEAWRAELARTGDPVDAYAAVVDDPGRRAAYVSRRGKGGFVRASWDEVADLVAASHVHTIRRHGPDRVVGFSPIPAMSMASYAAGARYHSLIGGVLTSFYDWYADLPPPSAPRRADSRRRHPARRGSSTTSSVTSTSGAAHPAIPRARPRWRMQMRSPLGASTPSANGQWFSTRSGTSSSASSRGAKPRRANASRSSPAPAPGSAIASP
jgi:nitrate reductase alpha subunit